MEAMQALVTIFTGLNGEVDEAVINACCPSTVMTATNKYEFKCIKVADTEDWDYSCTHCGTRFKRTSVSSGLGRFMASLVIEENK